MTIKTIGNGDADKDTRSCAIGWWNVCVASEFAFDHGIDPEVTLKIICVLLQVSGSFNKRA